MKNIWRKMWDCWLDFWEDDELDMNKKHLSQHDKRSLLYGGFMIGVATFGLFSIGIIAGNIWTNYQNQKDMEEFLGTIVTYMATATDDEYEEIAQTIRHDLVYSQYGQDVENLIRYIPNTADGCCLERELPERINLVFLNTGAAYGLEIFDNTEPIESQRERGSTMITSGYDEISEAHLMMMSNPNSGSATASIDRGRGIVSAHKMKTHFCDDCIREILTSVEDEFIDEAVIYDAEEKTFYPVTEGDLQIGDYAFHTYYEDGSYEIEIAYTANKRRCRCRNTHSHNGSFHFQGLRRKFMPECLISGDLRNSFFKVVRSSSESRLYLSWNALQNISVNCCTLSPGDCIAFWTSRISSSAGVVSGALSLSFSCALRMSWRMVSHVLCVTWQKKSSSST